MRKIITFLLLFSLAYSFSFGQNLSGIYSTVGQRIILSDDSLKLEFIGQPGVLGWTLAETTFKWVNKNFIEINSTPPYVLIREGMIIEQFMDSTITDSLKLSFSFPNYSSNYYYNKTPLDVSIYASLEIGYKDFNFS
ncbi:MAG: hypothetical protein LBI03_03455, partial [Clostridiales bacterium]|nr:hypothetical protein [Clostridiales bacterium]